jgi:hypothetical protein
MILRKLLIFFQMAKCLSLLRGSVAEESWSVEVQILRHCVPARESEHIGIFTAFEIDDKVSDQLKSLYGTW